MSEAKLRPIDSNNDDEISLKEIVQKLRNGRRYLQSKWKIIIFASIIGGLFGLGYSVVKKPVYTAELTFALEDAKDGGGLGAYAGLASQFGLDIGGGGGGAFSGDNLLVLMKSRAMVEKTLLSSVKINGREETLADLYINFNKFRDQWVNRPDLENVEFLTGMDRSKFSLQQDSLLGKFHDDIVLNNLTVDKIDKKLTIIDVSVKSKNELFSKYFTEVLVKNVSQFYVETKTKKSSQNLNILQHQTDSVRRELNAAISGVATSIDVNPNANPGRQILRAPSQHRQVDVQVNTAILSELVKNLEVAKVSLRNETPLIQVIDEPILPLQKENVGKLKGIFIGLIIGFAIAIIFISAMRFLRLILA